MGCAIGLVHIIQDRDVDSLRIGDIVCLRDLCIIPEPISAKYPEPSIVHSSPCPAQSTSCGDCRLPTHNEGPPFTPVKLSGHGTFPGLKVNHPVGAREQRW